METVRSKDHKETEISIKIINPNYKEFVSLIFIGSML